MWHVSTTEAVLAVDSNELLTTPVCASQWTSSASPAPRDFVLQNLPRLSCQLIPMLYSSNRSPS
jgi:hypothetical protein